jgi:hypothetical protein
MADMVLVRTFEVKKRSPGMIVLWSVLTIGIYVIFWYYFVNKELIRYGRALAQDGSVDPMTRQPVDSDALGSDASMSVLAITIGGLLLVPPYVSIYRFFGRLGRGQELAGVRHERASAGVGLVLAIVTLAITMFTLGFLGLGLWAMYAQTHLNKIWMAEKDTQTSASGRVASPPAPIAAPTTDDADKVCPDCAESVKAGARVCKHCGFRFNDDGEQTAS